MNVNTSTTIAQISSYLDKPESERPLARYREELLEPDRAFSNDEVARLTEIVGMDVPEYSKFSVAKLLIDLSWASSRLEGNTYTQLDTQVLIEYGKRNNNKPAEDAIMILNHKLAIEYMLSHTAISQETILAIHKKLADNSMAPESRHFLPPEKCGTVRSYTSDGLFINGSSYIPPQAEDRPDKYINHQFGRLIESVNKIPDPINQSFFLMTRIPYLQVFYDANKRTSRVSCNIPLAAAGLSPLSFVDFDKERYTKGLLAFYELGDARLAKNAYLDAYIASAFRYLNFGEDTRFSLASEWDKNVGAARRYVLEGIREAKPVWLGARGRTSG